MVVVVVMVVAAASCGGGDDGHLRYTWYVALVRTCGRCRFHTLPSRSTWYQVNFSCADAHRSTAILVSLHYEYCTIMRLNECFRFNKIQIRITRLSTLLFRDQAGGFTETKQIHFAKKKTSNRSETRHPSPHTNPE